MVPTENLEDLAEIENKPISEHALAGYFYLCFNRALFILDIDFSVKKKKTTKKPPAFCIICQLMAVLEL